MNKSYKKKDQFTLLITEPVDAVQTKSYNLKKLKAEKERIELLITKCIELGIKEKH